MKIYGLQKTTLLDYPEHVAATIFTGGCNFCCPFCHNRELVLPGEAPEAYTIEEIRSFLQKRKNILDGICITGGEPTLQPDLIPFIQEIKSLGYLVKLDTNGYRPEVLRELLQQHLIDYCAMDIKGSPEKYATICGKENLNFEQIQTSIHLLLSSSIDYEFRTTVMKEFHTPDDWDTIGQLLKGASHYYLQSYKESEQVISGGFHAYTTAELESFLRILAIYIPHTAIRGEMS